MIGAPGRREVIKCFDSKLVVTLHQRKVITINNVHIDKIMGITSQMESMALSPNQLPKLYKSICAKIDGTRTELIYAEHSDKIVIFCTQYEKIGSLFSVTKEQVESLDSLAEVVFSVKQIAGPENIEQEAAVRFIAEKLEINKKLCIFICLKTYDKEVVKAVVDALVNLRNNLI